MEKKHRFQREIKKRSASLVKGGLPLDAQPVHVAAVAIAIKEKLFDAKDSKRATNAARMANAVFDRSVAAVRLPFTLGCSEGCSSCCHLFTSATAPEIFAIVRQLWSERSANEIAHIIERCGPLIGKNVDERFGAKLPCPLLEDSRCSVYENRPLACRQCASGSRPACDAAFEGSNDEIPYSGPHILSGVNAKLCLHSALEATGRPSHSYELGEALMTALLMPDAEGRWLRGDDVFNSVQIDRSRQSEHKARVAFVSSVIA